MSDDYREILELPDLPDDADYKRVAICGDWVGILYIGKEGFCKVRYEGKVYRNRVSTRSAG